MDLIKKINLMDYETIDEEVSELELSLELEDMMDIDDRALELMKSEEICIMLRIPYGEADKPEHYRKLQLYAQYLKEEGQ